jgi:hypothetical protein
MEWLEDDHGMLRTDAKVVRSCDGRQPLALQMVWNKVMGLACLRVWYLDAAATGSCDRFVTGYCGHAGVTHSKICCQSANFPGCNGRQ